MTDYYAVLQVDPRAEPEVIEAAYRRLARKWHPDANPDPAAAGRIRDLNAAYEVLRDPERRRVYDLERAGTAVAARVSGRLHPIVAVGVAIVAALVVARFTAVLGRSGLVLLAVGAGLYWWLRRARQPS